MEDDMPEEHDDMPEMASDLQKIGAALASAAYGATPQLSDEQCSVLARTQVSDLLDAILPNLRIGRMLLPGQLGAIAQAWVSACRRGFQDPATVERITDALASENPSEQIRQIIRNDPRLTDSERDEIISIFDEYSNDSRPVEAPRVGPKASLHDRAYLKSIVVEGFRGIGKAASLPFDVGPGITIVYGLNGSGKSSFAEALDVLFAGDTGRFADRGREWRDAWFNVHNGERGRVKATFVGGNATPESTLTRSWTRKQFLEAQDDDSRFHETPDEDLKALGWTDAINEFRPILGYAEFGPLFDEDRIDDASESKTQLAQHLGQRVGIDDALPDHASKISSSRRWRGGNRPLQEELGAWDWIHDHGLVFRKGDSVASRWLGSVVPAGADGTFNDTIPFPRGWDWQAIVKLLDLAHTPGWRKTIRAHWRRIPRRPIEHDRQANRFSLRAFGVVLLRSARNWVPSSWQRRWRRRRWRGQLRRPVAERLPGWMPRLHVSFSIPDRREREQLVDKLRILAGEYRATDSKRLGISRSRSRAGKPRPSSRARVYAEMLGDASYGGPLETFSKRVGEMWEELRPGPAITLHGLELTSFYRDSVGSNRQRLAMNLAVDGVAGNERGVLSQGELQTLALCLFLPAMMRRESPFGFAVIDDPVQAMDEYAVDGLARVLRDAAEELQVIVFTHDERLPRALRLLDIEHTLINITRSAGSNVKYHVTRNPVLQALDDARLAAERLLASEDEEMWEVVGLHCRLAIEEAAIRTAQRKMLRKGVSTSLIRERLDDTAYDDSLQTKKLIALAIWGDARRIGEVTEHIAVSEPSPANWGDARRIGEVTKHIADSEPGPANGAETNRTLGTEINRLIWNLNELVHGNEAQVQQVGDGYAKGDPYTLIAYTERVIAWLGDVERDDD